jgi:hypothetical protein
MGSACIDPQYLDLALAGGEFSVSRLGLFTSGGRASGTHWIGSWRLSGPQRRSGPLGEETILGSTGNRTRPLDHPARSQSLYRLSYAGSTLLS